MDVRNDITEALEKALSELGIEGVAPTLERPADMAHGDFATNVALVAAKAAGKNPRELAEEILLKLNEQSFSFIEKTEIAGAGFINFHLNQDYFLKNLQRIDDEYGEGGSLKGKTILVEHTQPNVFKPFHIGHLKNNATGESLTRVIKNAGADVKPLNYQGDVGLHVAKALWGMQELKTDPKDIDAIGKAYAHGAQRYEEDEEAKQKINELNNKIYNGDPEVLELYETGRKTSLDHFEGLYRLLDTKFEQSYFESRMANQGIELVNEGKEKGIFKESEGAIVFPGEDYGLHTRVFFTSKGLPLYEAKELALAEKKTEDFPNFDLSITITGVEQEQYFEVVLKALSLLRPEFSGKFIHITQGLLQLSVGKMSSRLGNVITGESLIAGMIEEAKERIGERVPIELVDEVARDVAVAAIKYSMLRQSLRKNVIFDTEKSLSLEGDSGPYLQYTTVRAKSVVAKAHDAGIKPSVKTAPEEVGMVEKMLERFPEAAERAAKEYEPHHVATYAIELSSAFNTWYAGQKIVDEKDPLSPYRVAVTEAVATVLGRALRLLGIRVPAAM